MTGLVIWLVVEMATELVDRLMAGLVVELVTGD